MGGRVGGWLLRATLAWWVSTGVAVAAPNGPAPAPGVPAQELQGQLWVYVLDDFAGSSSHFVYELLPDAAEQRLEVVPPPAGTPSLATGDRVTVHGHRTGPGRFEADEILLMAPKSDGSGGGGGGGKGGHGGGSARGPRSVAIVLIDMADGVSLLDPAEATQVMWGPVDSANDLFVASSRGATSFDVDTDRDGAPDVFGPYALDASGAGRCDYRLWSNTARSRAGAEGHDLGNYDHTIYVLPNDNACSFGGVAELGGDEAWLNSRAPFAFAHEIGHNLDMNHAGTDPENDGFVNSSYGDASCLMGGSYRDVLHNAPHADQMGYLDAASTVRLSGTPGSYRFRLYPLDLDPAVVPGDRVVTIPKSDELDYYYLSFRGTGSYDVNLPSSYRTGVSLHRYAGSGSSMTLYLGTLATGESFVDDLTGVTVDDVWTAPDGSSVDVEVVLTPTCGARRPAVEVEGDPGSGLRHEVVVGPNEPAQYLVTLTDRDDAGCAAVEYDFGTRGLPTGMSARFEPALVWLTPGETTTVLLEVQPGDAPDGSVLFYVESSDQDGLVPDHGSAEDYARIAVDRTSARPLPPSDLTGSAATAKGQIVVSLDWVASPSPDVVRYHVGQASGDLIDWFARTSSTSLGFPWITGTTTFYVAAEGASGKISAPSAPFTLSISKGGGK